VPLQNRVDPWARLNAVPERGAYMGNRGILHDERRKVVRPWANKMWITCALEFGDRKRSVFSQSSYSELFFLDEATAFAAGHRPCSECRRDRFVDFKAAWLVANMPQASSKSTKIAELDKVLHNERAARGGGKVTHQASLGSLPSGTMFQMEGAAYLVWKRKVFAWSFGGYTPVAVFPASKEVAVPTPASLVRMFSSGFAPCVHVSAGG